MKSKILLIMISVFVLQMPACVPTDDDVYPDDPVAKFLGDWKVNENCSRMTYDVSIIRDPGNSTQVLIYNFGNPGPGYDPAVGLVVSSSIYVNSQTVGEGWTVDGKGTYQSGGTIQWDYTLVIPPSEYNCSATYFK